MSADRAGGTGLEPRTFLVRVDGLSMRQSGRCLVTFVEADSSTVIATRSFDSGFVAQSSLRQLMNIMSIGYRCKSRRVEQAARSLQMATRSVARALANKSTQPRSVKDSINESRTRLPEGEKVDTRSIDNTNLSTWIEVAVEKSKMISE